MSKEQDEALRRQKDDLIAEAARAKKAADTRRLLAQAAAAKQLEDSRKGEK